MNNDFEKELDGRFDGLIEYHRSVAGKRRLIGCKQLHEKFSKASSDEEEKQILKDFVEQLKKLATDVEVVLPHQYTDTDDIIRGHRMTPTESRLFEFPDPIHYAPKGFNPGVIYPLKITPLKIRDMSCIMKKETTNNQSDSKE